MSELEQNAARRSTSTQYQLSGAKIARFAIPSALGLFLFMAPVQVGGNFTIPIAVIVSRLYAALGSYVLLSLVTICIFTALASIAYSWLKFAWLPKNKIATQIFDTTPFWTVLRILGAVFGVMFYLQAGHPLIIGETTGRAAYVDIGEQMLLIFVTSCLFLPLLTHYGAMESR